MAENDQQQQNEIRREDQEKNFSDQVMKTNCFISHSQAKELSITNEDLSYKAIISKMDESEGQEEQVSSPTLHTLRTLERSWTGGSNESVQQWIDSLTEADLHGMTERPATPLEIESRAYANIHFLPIPGTGDDELSLGAEAKSLSRAGSEGGYSSFSPRLSPMILENSEPPEFPICNGSCEGELERFEGNETKDKVQPQDSRMKEKLDFKQMSEEESFTRQNNDMIAKKPAFAKQESFASYQSVSSLLAAMESDPEDVLQSLGFADASWAPFNRIPIRFLINSSQAKGIDVQKFCSQFMEHEDQESVSIVEEESKKRLLTRFSQSSIDLSLVDNEDGIQARIRRAKYRQSSIPSITVDIEDDEISGSDKNSQSRTTGFLRLSTVMEENEPSSRKSSLSRSFSNEKRTQLQKQERVDVTELENSVFGSIDKENVDINIEAVSLAERPINGDSEILKSGVNSQKLGRREESLESTDRKVDRYFNSIEVVADNRQNLFSRRIQLSGDENSEGKELKLLIPDKNNNNKSDKRKEISRPAFNLISNETSDRKWNQANENGSELHVPDVTLTADEHEGHIGVRKFAGENDKTLEKARERKIEESEPNFLFDDLIIEQDHVESVSSVNSLIDSIEVDACSFADSIEIDDESKKDGQESPKKKTTPVTNSEKDSFVRQFSEDSLETDEPSLSCTRNIFILEEQPFELDSEVPRYADRSPSRIVYRSLGKIENLSNDTEGSGSPEHNDCNEFENSERKSLRKGGIFGSLPFLSKSRRRTSSGSSFGVNSEKCNSRNTSDVEAQSTISDSYPFMKSKKRRSSTRIRDYFHKLVNGNIPSFTSNSSLDQSNRSQNQNDSSPNHSNICCDRGNLSCDRNNSSPDQKNLSCDQNFFSSDQNESSRDQYRRTRSHEDILSEKSRDLNSHKLPKQNNSLPVENGDIRNKKCDASLDNSNDERRDVGSEKSRPSNFERLISLLRSRDGPVTKAEKGDEKSKREKVARSNKSVGSKKGVTKKDLTNGIITGNGSKLQTKDKVTHGGKGQAVANHFSNEVSKENDCSHGKMHSNRNPDTSEIVRENSHVEFQESEPEVSQPEVSRKEKSREGFDPTGSDAVERIRSRMLTKGYSVESSGFEDEADLCKLTLERGRNIMEDGKRLLCMDCMQRRIGQTILENSLSTVSGTSHEERDRNNGPKSEISDVKSFAGGEEKEPRNSTPLCHEKAGWLDVNHFDYLVGQVTTLRKDLIEQEERMKTYIDESMERMKTSILTELSILNASFKTGSLDMSHRQTDNP